jgi:hypothetical protein
MQHGIFKLTRMQGDPMNTRLDRRVTRLCLLGAALSLGACNSIEPGVDDYQNSVVDARTAGQSLAGSFAQGTDWDAAVQAPATPSFTLNTQTQVLKKSTALPAFGSAAGSADLKVDLGDTAKGFVTVTNVVPGLAVVSHDTAVIKFDDKWKDGIADNENAISFKRTSVHLGGKVETLAITDADDDGQVTPVAGINNKARFVFTTSHLGVTETADLIVGSGPDNDFDAEGDNTVYKAQWTKTKGGVVIAQGEFKDGDNDGKVGDNASDQVVLASWFEMNPAGKPLVRKSTAQAKMKVFKDKAGDEPMSFSFTEEWKSGRVNQVTLKNRHGGEDIIKGDTMRVRIETTKAADDDTVHHAEITVVMNPGQDLKSDADDLCYSFHIKTQKRWGFERSAEFNFVAGEPVPHGQDAKSGSFDGKATYANGKSATLKGSFSPEGFSAEFTGPEGNTVKVEYAKSGDVI